MSKEFYMTGFDDISPSTEISDSTEKMEENRLNPQYPYTIEELQTSFPSVPGNTLYRHVKTVIETFYWLDESEFKLPSGKPGGRVHYSEYLFETLAEFLTEKQAGLTIKEYQEKMRRENSQAIEVFHAKENSTSKEEELITKSTADSPTDGALTVASTKAIVLETVNFDDMPKLVEAEILPVSSLTPCPSSNVAQMLQQLVATQKEVVKSKVEQANHMTEQYKANQQMLKDLLALRQQEVQADQKISTITQEEKALGEFLEKGVGKA